MAILLVGFKRELKKNTKTCIVGKQKCKPTIISPGLANFLSPHPFIYSFSFFVNNSVDAVPDS